MILIALGPRELRNLLVPVRDVTEANRARKDTAPSQAVIFVREERGVRQPAPARKRLCSEPGRFA